MLVLDLCEFEENLFSFAEYMQSNKGNNNISDEGCKHLSDARWSSCRSLILRKFTGRKVNAKLVTGVAHTWEK